MAQLCNTKTTLVSRESFDKNKRHRNWAYTWFGNEPKDKEDLLAQWHMAQEKFLDDPKRERFIGAPEICPSSGKLHIQGACQFFNAQYFGTILRVFNSMKAAHWEPCKKSFLANERYCAKGGELDETVSKETPAKEKKPSYNREAYENLCKEIEKRDKPKLPVGPRAVEKYVEEQLRIKYGAKPVNHLTESIKDTVIVSYSNHPTETIIMEDIVHPKDEQEIRDKCMWTSPQTYDALLR